MFVQESMQTPVVGEYDVVVCGGGFGGISAALAAARHGKRVLLIEKSYILGGLGTAGLVTIYLPLCDGYGHQVSFGIVEELFHLSIKHGAEARLPENWLCEGGSRTEHDPRFEVQYNPQLFAIVTEQLLREAGVEILYGTYAVGVTVNGEKIEHIVTENKSGRQAFRVRSVVDATGDCDVAKFADAPTELFKQGNVLAAWYYSLGKKGYRLNMLGYADVPDKDKKADHKEKLLVARRFGGLDGKELSEQMQLSHESTYNDFLKKRAEDPDFVPTSIATTPQIRMTRRLVGAYELAESEMHTYFEDSIGMVSNWKKRGPIWEIPFRTLYSAKVKNLICAGRCTSVDEPLWDVMRVIPCCAVTGQAAGTAAAMSDDFSTLDVKELQARLIADGVKLHEKDILS